MPKLNATFELEQSLINKERTGDLQAVRSVMQAWQYGFRTFDWKKAVPVPELVIKDVAELCALV